MKSMRAAAYRNYKGCTGRRSIILSGIVCSFRGVNGAEGQLLRPLGVGIEGRLHSFIGSRYPREASRTWKVFG